MKIAILTQYYPPEMGAPQARLSELAERLVRRGHQVFVLTAMPNYPHGRVLPGYGGPFKREDLNGVKVVRSYIYPTKSVGLFRRLANYLSFALSSLFTGLWALPRVDYLMTESPPIFLGMTGYILSKLKGARSIYNVSDLWVESAVRLGVVREGMAVRASRRLESFLYRRSWLISAQSREILAHVEAKFPGVATYHLPNGVDTGLFQPDRRYQAIRERLAPEGGCVAIYAGLHGVAQGLDQLLEAAALMGGDHKIRIVMVGDGPEKQQLMDRASSMGLKNIRFLDPFPREKMPALLASADIALVVLKTRLPGSVPSKIYEAMGTGLPIVVAAEGEAADIVCAAKAGIVVSPGDIKGIFDAIAGLAVDTEKQKELGRNGRTAAVERYDRDATVQKFVTHLETSL